MLPKIIKIQGEQIIKLVKIGKRTILHYKNEFVHASIWFLRKTDSHIPSLRIAQEKMKTQNRIKFIV